jgi:hypothetical protein
MGDNEAGSESSGEKMRTATIVRKNRQQRTTTTATAEKAVPEKKMRAFVLVDQDGKKNVLVSRERSAQKLEEERNKARILEQERDRYKAMAEELERRMVVVETTSLQLRTQYRRKVERIHEKAVVLRDQNTELKREVVQLRKRGQMLSLQNAQLQREKECCVCLSNAVDTVLTCGHTLCSLCVPSVASKCPQCRKKFDSTLRLYF